MTFQATIMFGLGFMSFLSAILNFFYHYDKLIAAIAAIGQPFWIRILDFRIWTSDLKFPKSEVPMFVHPQSDAYYNDA